MSFIADAADSFRSASDSVVGAVGKATDAVAGGVSKATDAVAGGVSQATDSVRSATDTVFQATTDSVKSATGTVFQATDSVKSATGTVMQATTDSVKSATVTVMQATDAVSDSVKNATTDAVSTFVPAFHSDPSDLGPDIEELAGLDHEALILRYLERAENAESYIEAIEKTGRAFDNAFSGLLTGIKDQTVDHVLDGVGKSVERSVAIEGAPAAFTRTLENFARELWKALLPKLRASLVGPVPGDYSIYLVRNWARRYPYFWSPDGKHMRPHTWLRARVLYALYPADKTIFQKLRQLPLYSVLMALKLDTITGIPIFAMQFALIDRRDEYQVVNFILSFKTFHFVTGVIIAVLCASDLYNCLYTLNAIDDIGAAAATCNALMSSSSWEFPWQIAMEAPRFGMIFYAMLLLMRGQTRGGSGELRALAEVRIDAADGTLDGYSDIAAIALDPTRRAGRWDSRMPTVRELDAAKDAARIRFDAQPGTGYFLPTFLLVDLGVLAFLLIVFGRLILVNGWGPSDAMFWHTLYYLKLAYALCAWPYLVFLTPLFGPALHGACATGYDMSGLCVPKLSNAKIRKKDHLTAIRTAHESKLNQKAEAEPWRIAWRESTARRWIYGVAALNPFVRSAARSTAAQGFQL